MRRVDRGANPAQHVSSLAIRPEMDVIERGLLADEVAVHRGRGDGMRRQRICAGITRRRTSS